MNEEFIPYEEALALKELGFDEKCFASWWNDQLVTDYIDQEEIDALSRPSAMSKNYSYMLAPLYQQAFRWFREKYNLHAIFEHDSDNYYYVIQGVNDFDFTTIDGSEENELYLIHEEAELACLKKLIEIVNQNKDE